VHLIRGGFTLDLTRRLRVEIYDVRLSYKAPTLIAMCFSGIPRIPRDDAAVADSAFPCRKWFLFQHSSPQVVRTTNLRATTPKNSSQNSKCRIAVKSRPSILSHLAAPLPRPTRPSTRGGRGMPSLRRQAQLALPQMKRRLGESAFAEKSKNRLRTLPAVVELPPSERLSLDPRTSHRLGHQLVP
jgi:hypothetical protein